MNTDQENRILELDRIFSESQTTTNLGEDIEFNAFDTLRMTAAEKIANTVRNFIEGKWGQPPLMRLE